MLLTATKQISPTSKVLCSADACLLHFAFLLSCPTLPYLHSVLTVGGCL